MKDVSYVLQEVTANFKNVGEKNVNCVMMFYLFRVVIEDEVISEQEANTTVERTAIIEKEEEGVQKGEAL